LWFSVDHNVDVDAADISDCSPFIVERLRYMKPPRPINDFDVFDSIFLANGEIGSTLLAGCAGIEQIRDGAVEKLAEGGCNDGVDW
jgi:hypothetical protein